MSKKHDPIIHAAIIQAAATITAGGMIARAARGALPQPAFDEFSAALELVEARYDAHLKSHNEK